MIQVLSGLWPDIPEEGYIAESEVLLQVSDSRYVGAQGLDNLLIAEIRELQPMIGMFDHHLVSTQVAHLVIKTLRLSRGVSLNSVNGIPVRNDANLPARWGSRIYIEIRWAKRFLAGTKRTDPGFGPTNLGHLLYDPALRNRVSS
jgi:hypothetical protein